MIVIAVSAFHDTCNDVWLIQGGLNATTTISDFSFESLHLIFIGTKKQNSSGTDLQGYSWHGTLQGETYIANLELNGSVFTEFDSEVRIIAKQRY